MEDLLRSYYVEPDKIVVEKKDKEIDFDVEYVPESEMEASQAVQDRGDATSLIPETQTPETDDIIVFLTLTSLCALPDEPLLSENYP